MPTGDALHEEVNSPILTILEKEHGNTCHKVWCHLKQNEIKINFPQFNEICFQSAWRKITAEYGIAIGWFFETHFSQLRMTFSNNNSMTILSKLLGFRTKSTNPMCIITYRPNVIYMQYLLVDNEKASTSSNKKEHVEVQKCVISKQGK